MVLRRLRTVFLALCSILPAGWGGTFALLLPDEPGQPSPAFVFLSLAILVACFAALAYFIFLASRSPHVPSAKRARWRWLLLFGNAFAMPVFWYLFLRQEPTVGEAAGAVAPSSEERLQAILDEHLSKRRP